MKSLFQKIFWFLRALLSLAICYVLIIWRQGNNDFVVGTLVTLFFTLAIFCFSKVFPKYSEKILEKFEKLQLRFNEWQNS